jgi:Flagellar hook-length control protein FliK
MVDEATKVDIAKQDRLREQAAEKQKPKAQESEFDQLLKKGQLSQPSASQPVSKTLTEQAVQEATRRQDREGDEKKDEREDKGKREARHGGERRATGAGDQRVLGKGTMGQGGRGSEGGGREGGFEGQAGRRGLSTRLTRAGAKSVPIDLSGKFATKMTQMGKGTAAARQAVLSQQVLNKIVQYVRIGINRAGDKEIQLDLHEAVFRGLKLRITARGGKVGVHFRTADAASRSIFERNRAAIRNALNKKGIEVDEMVIT